MSIIKNIARSFRFTCKKKDIPLVEDLLRAQKFIFEPDPFLPLIQRVLQEPFPLGRSLAAFWGLIYIQDRSSILPVLALNPTKGEFILDMCASPGSKTSLLAQLVGENGLVVGNEPSKNRLVTLRRNLSALNVFNTVTCSYAGENIPIQTASWETILLDPPCSGWGTSIKNPQALKIWKGNRILPLIALQKKLLTEATRLLKPGGKLVYSTCTTNIDENEAQICFAQDTLGLKIIPLEVFPGFSYTNPLLNRCEGTLCITKNNESQGFYIACLQKPLGKNKNSYQQKFYIPPELSYIPSTKLNYLNIDIKKFPQGELATFGATAHFLPQAAINNLPKTLYWQGPFIGKYSKENIIPSPRFRLFSKSSIIQFPQLHVENIDILEKLIQGQSIQTTLSGKDAILLWKELPLGKIRLKNGRAFWSEK